MKSGRVAGLQSYGPKKIDKRGIVSIIKTRKKQQRNDNVIGKKATQSNAGEEQRTIMPVYVERNKIKILLRCERAN